VIRDYGIVHVCLFNSLSTITVCFVLPQHCVFGNKPSNYFKINQTAFGRLRIFKVIWQFLTSDLAYLLHLDLASVASGNTGLSGGLAAQWIIHVMWNWYEPGPQPADIFVGWQNDCKLLYLTTKHAFENFGEGNCAGALSRLLAWYELFLLLSSKVSREPWK